MSLHRIIRARARRLVFGVAASWSLCGIATAQMSPEDAFATDVQMMMILAVPDSQQLLDPDKKAIAPDDRDRFLVVAREATCETFVPGHRERAARDYAAWRAARARELARLDARADASASLAGLAALLDKARQQATPPPDPARFAAACGALAERLSLRQPVHDAALASPDDAWNTLLRALQAADRRAALRVIGWSQFDAWATFLRDLPDEAVRTRGRVYRLLSMAAPEDEDASGTFAREIGGIGRIHGRVVFHRDEGNWQVSDLSYFQSPRPLPPGEALVEDVLSAWNSAAQDEGRLVDGAALTVAQRSLLFVTRLQAWCAQVTPGHADRSAPAYATWRAHRQPGLGDLESRADVAASFAHFERRIATTRDAGIQAEWNQDCGLLADDLAASADAGDLPHFHVGAALR